MSEIWKCFLLVIVVCVSVTNCQINCLKCDSNVDPNCSRRPEIIGSTESCQKGCVTLIDTEGNTVRRCALDSDDCIHSNCEKCTNNKCNSEIFPSNRPKCYQCSGSSCLFINPSDKELPCRKFVESDQCYTYVLNERNATRGCVSDENRECIEAKELCKLCNDRAGCNNQMGLYTVRCFNCDSSTNKKCQRPDTPPINKNCEIDNAIPKCSYQELLGRQGNCYTTIFEHSTVRSCRPIKSNTISESCKGDLCNTRCIADLTCIQCNKNDTNCDDEGGLESFNKSCPAYTTSCYRCENFEGKDTERGCGFKNSYPWGDKNSCSTCTGKSGCYAAKPPRLCYKCNSSINAMCSSLKIWPDAELFLESCQKPDDYCIAILTKEGYTVRGCMNEIENVDCSDINPNCKKCNTHYCNLGIIPQNRLLCHQCDGRSNSDCNKEQSYLSRTACAKYTPNDKCYTFANSENRMIRGCDSDDDYNSQICNILNICVKCDYNNCNKLPYIVSPRLSCYKCEANNEECPWGYNGSGFVSCQNHFEYYKEESCFIKKHENGSVTRGCTLDSEICSKNDENCTRSKVADSNGNTTVIQKCYQCKSANNKDCADNPKKLEPIACKNALTTYKLRGCYKWAQESNIERGCIGDLESTSNRNCFESNYCHVCFPDNCNKSSSKAVSMLAILSIMFYWIFSNEQ